MLSVWIDFGLKMRSLTMQGRVAQSLISTNNSGLTLDLLSTEHMSCHDN